MRPFTYHFQPNVSKFTFRAPRRATLNVNAPLFQRSRQYRQAPPLTFLSLQGPGHASVAVPRRTGLDRTLLGHDAAIPKRHRCLFSSASRLFPSKLALLADRQRERSVLDARLGSYGATRPLSVITSPSGIQARWPLGDMSLDVIQNFNVSHSSPRKPHELRVCRALPRSFPRRLNIARPSGAPPPSSLCRQPRLFSRRPKYLTFQLTPRPCPWEGGGLPTPKGAPTGLSSKREGRGTRRAKRAPYLSIR
jgi:hypothetical protein